MPYASINGIELYYETQGEGPPIVFAHGVGGNHVSWYQQVPFFARQYQAVTVDQRGFGLTEDANGLGRGGFVEDLHGLIDHLGFSKVSLVVQSMGGATGMGFTVKYPERVNALVMADTLVGITLPEEIRARQQANSAATRDLSQLERVVARSLPSRDPAKAELYLQVASFNKSNANRFNMSGTSADPITMDQVAAAARQVPMLFLVGQEDVLQPAEVVSAAAAIVPNAELAIVPDAGHSVYWEQPEVFNHVVNAFLAKVLPRE
ncbi:MAG: alpha/beta fold hydrolase [Dehalococcoidia bacterium]|nr:alpha/beta fold hydrolase [Dehalococcoidia bacterium]